MMLGTLVNRCLLKYVLPWCLEWNVMNEQLLCLSSWDAWAAVIPEELWWLQLLCLIPVMPAAVMLDQLLCLIRCDALAAMMRGQLEPSAAVAEHGTAVKPIRLWCLYRCEAWAAEQLRCLRSCNPWRCSFALTTWKAWILNICDVCKVKMLEQAICFTKRCLNNCNTWTAVTPKQLCDWTAVTLWQLRCR
jgi:hypothetical protein